MRAPYEDKAIKNKIRGALRRAFSSLPLVTEIKKAGRIEKVKYNKDGTPSKSPDIWYTCEYCGAEAKGAKNKKGMPFIQVDHNDPVIPLDREIDSWDEFIERLYCDASNLKRVCSVCHHKKTKHERLVRKNPTLEELASYYDIWRK